jgi:type 1 glutamine amidotransferase
MLRTLFIATLACLSLASAQTRKIRAAILTGQHSYPQAAFFSVFDAMPDLEYVHIDMPDESEAFEDISKWNYDVIVMHNSGQKISVKRQQNFLALLNRGVGLVVVHHAVCAYEDWPEFKKIIGSKFHGNPETIDGHTYASNYKEPTPVPIVIDDKKSPLMAGFKDTTITDEVYTDMSYESDSHILAHTTSTFIPGKQIIWTRRYSNANVFTITIGHRAATLTGPIMGKLVPDAIRWSITAVPSAVIAPVKVRNGSFPVFSDGAKVFFQNPSDVRQRWDAKGSLLILREK